jgi:1,4-alpha-glucan branching enzyme
VTGRDSPDSLGFDLKWNLGWMHDTLGYAERDPVFRRHHHNNLTFSLVYAFSERFLLPLSHDEVVHGKRSLLSKMPGDAWQQLANLRILFGFQYAHPGKKLQFMGGEFGVLLEWNHDAGLDWSLLGDKAHSGLRAFVKELNGIYVSNGALHEVDFGWEGFQWIDCDDAERSVVSFLRRGKNPAEPVAVVANFTPVPRENHRIGVPLPGRYEELLNSDATEFGGSGVRNPGALQAEPVPANGQPYSLTVTLPPLGIVFLGPAAHSIVPSGL